MRDNIRGSIYMLLAMACFSIEDALIKAAAKSVPLAEIIFLFGFFGCLIFLVLLLSRGEKVIHPALFSRAMFIRSICEIIGRLFFSIALVLIPLSSLSAILQATPLVVVSGAAIFFGEKVGWRRWTAITVGFIGVLMIIRPGLEGFQLASLFAVLGTLGFAGRDLATRASPNVLSNIQLGVYGFFVLMPAGLCIMVFDGSYSQLTIPSPFVSFQILATAVFGVTAYYALTVAMRVGEVSVVTPFRYTRLLFALIIGITIFDERPDLFTLVGSVIIISSGLFTLLRTKQKPKTMKQ